MPISTEQIGENISGESAGGGGGELGNPGNPPAVLPGEAPPPEPGVRPRTWAEAADELRAQIAALRGQFLELRADLTRADPRSGSGSGSVRAPSTRAAPSPMGTFSEPDPIDARTRRVRAAAAAGDRGALLAYMRLRRA